MASLREIGSDIVDIFVKPDNVSRRVQEAAQRATESWKEQFNSMRSEHDQNDSQLTRSKVWKPKQGLETYTAVGCGLMRTLGSC